MTVSYTLEVGMCGYMVKGNFDFGRGAHDLPQHQPVVPKGHAS